MECADFENIMHTLSNGTKPYVAASCDHNPISERGVRLYLREGARGQIVHASQQREDGELGSFVCVRWLSGLNVKYHEDDPEHGVDKLALLPAAAPPDPAQLKLF